MLGATKKMVSVAYMFAAVDVGVAGGVDMGNDVGVVYVAKVVVVVVVDVIIIVVVVVGGSGF